MTPATKQAMEALRPFTDEAKEWSAEARDGMRILIGPNEGEDKGHNYCAKFNVGDLRRAAAAYTALEAELKDEQA